MPTGAENPASGANPPALTEDEIAATAEEGYLFGYPLVLMDVSRRVMTAVSEPDEFRAPMGQFNVSQRFPDASFTDVVSPNVDTLYSSAWIDLGEGPMILSLPDTGDRYYVIEMLDAWTNVFASAGTRTTGHRAGHFALLGPGWKGSLPAGVQAIRSPTALVWIVGRTKTDGPSDYAAVVSLKSKYALTPLSQWETGYTPPPSVPIDTSVDRTTPPAAQVADLSATKFFARLAQLMEHNPPAPADAAIIERLAKVRVRPGADFNGGQFDPRFAQAIERGVARGRTHLIGGAHEPVGRMVNGWDVMTTGLGRYGTDYGRRAVVALVGLGANLPEDAVYPHATSDAKDEPLTGRSRYRIHFGKDELPPVDAFWSITLYDPEQHFADNPLHRYALGNRDDLRFGPDGSLDIYVQHDSPGDALASNWLPAPEDDFNLLMRLYQPRREVLDGSWKPPPVQPQP